MNASTLVTGIALACTPIAVAQDWIWANTGVYPLTDVVIAGHDANKTSMYICAGDGTFAIHSGSTINGYEPFVSGVDLPGRTSSNTRFCIVGYGGRQHDIDPWHFSYLATKWERDLTNGAIPANALQGGNDTGNARVGGPPLYYCRVYAGGGLLPGKIRPGFGGCAVPDPSTGTEQFYIRYDVLVRQDLPLTTVADSGGHVPDDAVTGGYEPVTRNPLYICSASYNGQHPGTLRKGKGCAISYGGQIYTLVSYRVLVTSWEPNSLFSVQTPKYDFVVGQDADGTKLLACRGYDRDGGVLPGRYRHDPLHPNLDWGVCQAGKDGSEQSYTVFDLLTSRPQSGSGPIPPL